jgi:LacI family transcriptional regulator
MTQIDGERPATIEDVARLAGVSRAAVSKVIRNAYGVSPAMRERVGTAIDELSYRPRVAARAMRGSSYTVGIEIPDFSNQFFTKVLGGAADALAGSDYQLLIAPTEAAKREGYRALEALVDQQVDGVIAVSPLVDKSWLENIARRTPVVLFGRHHISDRYDTVTGDDELGAAEALTHLFDLGHDRVLHLTRDGLATAPQRHTPHGVRLQTYLRVMEETGRGAYTRVLRSGEGQACAYQVVRHLLETEEHPTAIFAAHDELALGVLHATEELGVDISVVGYDNVPLAAHPAISLTSVDQQGEAMGARAIQLLLERIGGRSEAVHDTFTPSLQVRGSTRPLA